jgi:hypothetical protein
VQTARYLVARVVELSPGVKHGHDHLGRGALFGWMLAHGNSAPVVLDGDGPVEMDLHVDTVAMTGQGLVDRVVHHLVDHVVETGAVVGVPDVHTGPLADRLEPLENLDALFVVLVRCKRRGRRHGHPRRRSPCRFPRPRFGSNPTHSWW